jgi:hypothetical protein
LSGIRREKETTPAGLDIEDYTPDPGDSDRRGASKSTWHPAFDITILKGFVFAIAIGLAVVGLVSVKDDLAVIFALKPASARDR